MLCVGAKGDGLRIERSRGERMRTAVVILCVRSGDVLSFDWYLASRSALTPLTVDRLFQCDIPAERHFEKGVQCICLEEAM